MVLSDSNFMQAFISACERHRLNFSEFTEALKMEYLLLELASQHNPLAQQFYNASHQKLSALWQNFFDQAVAALKFIGPASY